MASITEAMRATCRWPWQVMKLSTEALDAAMAANRVVSARLPILASALRYPYHADYGEICLMMTEKVQATFLAGHAFRAKSEEIQDAVTVNACILGGLTLATLPRSDQIAAIVKNNFVAAAALADLPGVIVAPFDDGLRTNDARLGRQADSDQETG